MRLLSSIVFLTLVLVCRESAQTAPTNSAATSVLPNAPSSVAEKRAKKWPELLADDPYRPLSKKDKVHEWLRRTYAPSTFLSAGVDTAYSGMTDSMRYCCGGDAWLKQYGASFADAQGRNFFGRFLFPTLLKQDPRYLPKRRGNFFARSWYAASRVVVTRKDNGGSTFNSSEFLAIAFSKALSNAYYPEHDRSWERTGNDILGALQGDASGFLLNEFTPDLKRIFFRHTPKVLLNVSNRLSESRRLQSD